MVFSMAAIASAALNTPVSTTNSIWLTKLHTRPITQGMPFFGVPPPLPISPTKPQRSASLMPVP